MLPAAPALAPSPDLLGRLCRALEAREPARSIRDALARCGLPEARLEQLVAQLLVVGERARRAPRASLEELQLALGVLLVACGAPAQHEAFGEAGR